MKEAVPSLISDSSACTYSSSPDRWSQLMEKDEKKQQMKILPAFMLRLCHEPGKKLQRDKSMHSAQDHTALVLGKTEKALRKKNTMAHCKRPGT